MAEDGAPHFFLPLGFAGGAVDRWTGFVRFGHRDYDPEAGRVPPPIPWATPAATTA